MGLLAIIERGVKEILGITPPSERQYQSDAGEIVVIEGAGSENTDAFKGSSGKPANPASKENLGQLKEAMEIKLQKAGLDIDAEQLLKRTMQHFNINPNEISDQKKLLEAMSNEIDHFIALKSEISEQVDINEVMAKGIQNVYEAVVESGIDITEFNEKRGNILAELGERFKQASPEERRVLIEELAEKEKAAFESYLEAELSKVPESERAVKEQEMRKLHEYVIRARFLDFMTQDSETALNAIVMLSADDMDYGIEAVLETRCDEAERMRTADMADYEFTDGLLQSYYARGEKVSAQTMRSYTEASVSAKSSEAARQYQADYETARDAWESGESRPEYMSSELFTATAQGIGEGVMSNSNMTSDEKAEFIAAWKECASKYDDYEKVVQKVYQELEKDRNKELAEKVKSIAAGRTAAGENIEVKESGGSNDAVTNDKTNTAGNVLTLSSGICISPSYDTVSQAGGTTAAGAAGSTTTADETEGLTIGQKASNTIIANDIRTNGLTYREAVEKYGKVNVIAAALDNDIMGTEVETYLRSADKNSVIQVVWECTKGNSVLTVYEIVNDELKSMLEELIKNKGLPSAVLKEIEALSEQRESDVQDAA